MFKEFITEIFKTATSDSFGLFLENRENRTYYPNPKSVAILNYHDHFTFLGMIVGKAIQIGVLIPIDFA